MELKIAKTLSLGSGSAATAIHTSDNKLRLIYVDPLEKKLMAKDAETPFGVWENLIFSPAEVIAPDSDVLWVDSARISHFRDWYFWGTEEKTFNRMATDPDNGPKYVDSPYRLYYGVDTELLYMNISEYWTVVGSPNITKLIGYPELENRVATVEDLIANMSTYDDTAVLGRLDTIEQSLSLLHNYDDTSVLGRLDTIEQRLTDIEARLTAGGL